MKVLPERTRRRWQGPWRPAAALTVVVAPPAEERQRKRTVLSGDWTTAAKVAAQELLLGASVTAHPLELVADRISRAKALTTVGAAGRVGQRVRVAGTRQTWRRVRTVQGGYIYFMALEDLEGMLDVVISGDFYFVIRHTDFGRDFSGGAGTGAIPYY